MDKKFAKLPKEGLVQPEERKMPLIDSDDVEGHGLPLTPPPSFGTRTPGHGGEIVPMDDDAEGFIDRAGPEGIVRQ